ncbi:hypothetical protein [Mesorhizobium sp. 113-3-9]|nr:hypothetical protein [Mesorhizobium sp. 113-3-9]
MDAKTVSLSLCSNGFAHFESALKFIHHMNFAGGALTDRRSLH